MPDTTRGCIVCGVSVRLPSLMCSDCSGEGSQYMQQCQRPENDGILVWLTNEGPVEVADDLLYDAVSASSDGWGTEGGKAGAFREYLRANAKADMAVITGPGS